MVISTMVSFHNLKGKALRPQHERAHFNDLEIVFAEKRDNVRRESKTQDRHHGKRRG